MPDRLTALAPQPWCPTRIREWCPGAEACVRPHQEVDFTWELPDTPDHAPASSIRTRSQQRWLLLLGLGGLLVLLVTLGASAISFLKKIEGRHESIRVDFVSRMRVLEQLRNDVYRSGTRVHDFMLENDPARAAGAREDVLASRRHIEALEDEYARSLRPEERDLFASLRHEVDVYFEAVVPVLDWTLAERQQRVDPFVRDQLHPRRSVMLRIADEIEGLNGQDMDRNSADTNSLFLSYRRLLLALVALTFGIGLALAMFSLWRITGLEAESESRFRQVEHAKVELHALSIKLVDTQETERRKLARELHDEIGQGLWAVVLGLGNAAAADSGDSHHQRRHEKRPVYLLPLRQRLRSKHLRRPRQSGRGGDRLLSEPPGWRQTGICYRCGSGIHEFPPAAGKRSRHAGKTGSQEGFANA